MNSPLDRLRMLLRKVEQMELDDRSRGEALVALQQAQQELQLIHFELRRAHEIAVELHNSKSIHVTRLTLSRMRQ